MDESKLGSIDVERGQLTLPFSQNQFREFISSLFGKPDQLERPIYGCFDVELSDIRDFYLLIDDRVSQQNKGILGQFSAKVIYDDASSVQLNSFESLTSFIEPKALIPRRVELNWQYLIKFQDKNVPEKQEIEVIIFTHASKFMRRQMIAYRTDYRYYKNSGFTISIKYTARTWATDIESLLSRHIETLLKPASQRNWLGQRIEKYREVLGIIGGVLFFLLSVIGGFVSTSRLISSRLSQASSFLNESADLEKKVEFIVDYILSGGMSQFYFFLAIFILTMLVASIFLGNLIRVKGELNVEKSHILLTKMAIKEKEDTLRAERNWLRNFILSVSCGIFINILSSYAFMYMTSR